MTKEQIIAGLKNAAKPYEEYYIEDDLIDAINQYPEPFELVEPILEIIATNPLVDFGMPGDLVHFVEQFYKHGYEELLISSVRKNPTPHNIWMVHRCYNGNPIIRWRSNRMARHVRSGRWEIIRIMIITGQRSF